MTRGERIQQELKELDASIKTKLRLALTRVAEKGNAHISEEIDLSMGSNEEIEKKLFGDCYKTYATIQSTAASLNNANRKIAKLSAASENLTGSSGPQVL